MRRLTLGAEGCCRAVEAPASLGLARLGVIKSSSAAGLLTVVSRESVLWTALAGCQGQAVLLVSLRIHTCTQEIQIGIAKSCMFITNGCS